MKKIVYLIVLFALSGNFTFAQVGIGTTAPAAQMDIRSSNQATPTNNDGILIPKVDAFPAINPTVTQQGMMVYLTTTTTFLATSRAPGFYYWNDPTSDWIGLNSAANGDHDWYEEGTTTAPNAITDDMFHTGNVAIGKNTADFPLEVNTTNFDKGILNTYASSVTNGIEKYALHNNLSITGDDTSFATRTTISGSGNGTLYGNYSNISNTGSGNHFGAYNDISGNGTGFQFGTYNFVVNNGNASHFGTSNVLGGTGNGPHYGVFNTMASSGIGGHYGMYNSMTGNNAGVLKGVVNSVSSTGNSVHYGVENELSGSGSGQHIGNYNNLNGIGTGAQYGTVNTITNIGSSQHYGVQNILNSSGLTTKYGVYNEIWGNGNGNFYGVFSDIRGIGTGAKYGSYNYIATTSGGTHYGVYSEVLKAGATNFAGYFIGNVGIGTAIGNTYILPPSRGTVGQTMRTDAAGNVTWANNSDFAWSLTGNATAAANFIGTTNAQAFRFYCNNIERMRINPTDGEIVVGAVASPYAGDELAAVATPTLTFALNGYSAQNGSGTWGEILAASSTAFSAVQGVYGGTGVGSGVLGNYAGSSTSNTRSGVYGVCGSPAATNGGAGVYGYNAIASGNQHIGVLGAYNGAAFGIGVHGVAFGGGIITGNIDSAVVGWRANNANYSGYFNGNHVIANGTKSASVGTSKGNQLLYVTETPGVWFEDIGRGKLSNGTVEIKLDPLFLETVAIDDEHPMSVFLQEEGDSNGLYVIPGKDGFIVKEKNGGTSNIAFSYRIMAKRLHFQDHRFGNDPVWGEGDTRKYNQDAPVPPIDYNENVKFQEEQKRNYKPNPMPEGFIDYFQLQEEAKKVATEKPKEEKTTVAQ